MVVLQMLSFLLIALLLMSMMAKARPWAKTPPPGKTLQTVPLGFLPKLLTYRSILLALLMGCALTVTLGWLPVNMAGVIIAFALLIVLIPVRYTLTTKGVAVGDMFFRPWSDFSGYHAKKSSLELVHPSSFGRLTLFIKPAQMGSVLKHIERHVQIQSSNP
jgi:hypothetical protein